MSIGRSVGLLAVMFGILVGGTWVAVKVTTDHLLYQNATSTARRWAQYLTENVNDLEQIAAGEQPSAADMVFFQAIRRPSQVFRYEIFNRQGYSQLVADRDKVTLVDVSEYSAEAAHSIDTGQPIVDAKEGASSDFPSYFAQAYVPVLVDNRPIAIVAAYVDQTEQRDSFYHTFLIAAASLCLLTGLSFAVPAFAWYRRTREKQRADRHIRFLAQHDALTGLINRGHLTERMDGALRLLAEDAVGLAVYFLDCDRFKQVNDTWGHDGGDFLLNTIAERLRSVASPCDLIARLGGDEFVLVRSDVGGRDLAAAFAQRVVAALAVPLRFKGHEIHISVSVGVALAPRDGQSPERLLKSADLALYQAKADGRNCVRFFEPRLDAELMMRNELERTVRDAVLHNRFELHYQPIFAIATQRLIGFEALVRLRKEDGTLIGPLTFIPIAEDMRLIDKIGAWVLREACGTAAKWPSHLTVAVNLSPAQFAAGSVRGIVAAALEDAHLEPHRLELEITETLLLGDTESVMAELLALKAIGVAIVMDGFGKGCSSLSYLWRIPFNKIKIDQGFMKAFEHSERDAETVVKTIIEVGRVLNIQITVEGVETANQAAFLDEADGGHVQGFLFGRPMPAVEIASVIRGDFHHAQANSPGESESRLRLVK